MLLRIAPDLLAAAVLLGAAAPALAATNCNAIGSGGSFGFSVHGGEPFSEEDETDFALMELRSLGVDATRVERWGGCYRAYVRQADGRQRMEYFNADTLEPVDD